MMIHGDPKNFNFVQLYVLGIQYPTLGYDPSREEYFVRTDGVS